MQYQIIGPLHVGTRTVHASIRIWKLYPEMRGFIQNPDNNLKHYFLDAEQVKLVENLCEALLVSP